MNLRRCGSQPSTKGPAEYFTGNVRIDPLFDAPDPARARAASVTFELGQNLIVTSGCGWVQSEGGPKGKYERAMWSRARGMKSTGMALHRPRR